MSKFMWGNVHMGEMSDTQDQHKYPTDDGTNFSPLKLILKLIYSVNMLIPTTSIYHILLAETLDTSSPDTDC